MKNVVVTLVLTLGLSFAAIGCSPDAKATCEKLCLKVGNCMSPTWTSTQIGTCKVQADCDHANDNPMHCKNFNEQAVCANNCLNRECGNAGDGVLSCLNGCPACQQ